jgi:hypothetical protein
MYENILRLEILVPGEVSLLYSRSNIVNGVSLVIVVDTSQYTYRIFFRCRYSLEETVSKYNVSHVQEGSLYVVTSLPLLEARFHRRVGKHLLTTHYKGNQSPYRGCSIPGHQ